MLSNKFLSTLSKYSFCLLLISLVTYSPIFAQCDIAQAAGNTGYPADPVCEATICAGDTFCCNVTWDAICVDQVVLSPDCCGCVSSPDPAVCAAPVPTLGEWGIILFTLLLLNMGVVFMIRRRRASKLASA